MGKLEAIIREPLLYDYDRAADALSLTRAALRDLVYKGRGPRVTKIGRRTFFAHSDLEEFVQTLRDPETHVDAENVARPVRKRGRPSVIDQIRSQQQV